MVHPMLTCIICDIKAAGTASSPQPDTPFHMSRAGASSCPTSQNLGESWDLKGDCLISDPVRASRTRLLASELGAMSQLIAHVKLLVFLFFTENNASGV